MAANRLLLLLLGLMLASPALAAEEGALGASSRGEIVITVSVAAHVVLSGGKTTADGDGQGEAACLWLGTATRGYAVIALEAPIVWRPSAMSSGRIVAADATLDGLSSAARPDCDGDPALFVGYAATSATSHPATLLIAPE